MVCQRGKIESSIALNITLWYLPIMLEIRHLIRFFDTGFILKIFFLFLLFSLLPVGEMFFIIYLDSYVNTYLLVASIMILSFLGFILSYIRICFILNKIKKDISEGIYPEKRFMQLAGSFAASFFLILPGFISFLTGIFILFPGINRRVGKLVNSSSSSKTKELYEYLKLYDL